MCLETFFYVLKFCVRLQKIFSNFQWDCLCHTLLLFYVNCIIFLYQIISISDNFFLWNEKETSIFLFHCFQFDKLVEKTEKMNFKMVGKQYFLRQMKIFVFVFKGILLFIDFCYKSHEICREEIKMCYANINDFSLSKKKGLKIYF